MIIGALVWFIAMTGLYAFSERQAERFVAALPPEQTATSGDDGATEHLRRRAVLWRRWWPWISLAMFPLFVLGGAGLSALGIGIDHLLPFNDLRAIIQGLLIIGVAFCVARLLWERRPPRDI
jgi:hypothetical protein